MERAGRTTPEAAGLRNGGAARGHAGRVQRDERPGGDSVGPGPLPVLGRMLPGGSGPKAGHRAGIRRAVQQQEVRFGWKGGGSGIHSSSKEGLYSRAGVMSVYWRIDCKCNCRCF